MNLALLDVLRARRGVWCGADELAAHLFTDAARIADGVQRLKAIGYLINERDNRYQFEGVSDRLIPHEITHALATRAFGRNVVSLDKVASTNDEAWRLFRRGAAEGTTVLAESQTGGRGRFGRSWVCPPGAGILMSTVLKPPGLKPAQSSVLTVMAAVAVVETLNEELRVPALIKWPNDVIARGRKLGGILLETRLDPHYGRGFVLGVGLNVNLAEQDLPSDVRDTGTSLHLLTGTSVSRISLVRALLRSLDRWYQAALTARHGLIAQQWRRYSSTLGGRITLEENGRRYTGRVIDISLDEGIVLSLDRGGTRIFDGGRVTVVPPPGGEPQSP